MLLPHDHNTAVVRPVPTASQPIARQKSQGLLQKPGSQPTLVAYAVHVGWLSKLWSLSGSLL